VRNLYKYLDLTSTETPQHMSYETPKPSFGQENDASFPNPEPQNSELDEVAGGLGFEYHLRNEDQPVTSTNRDNPDCEASPTTRILDQIEVIDLTGDSEQPSVHYIAQRQIVPKEQNAKAVDEMLMTELLSEDFTLARQLRKDGQHSRAAKHYFNGFEKYIDEGGKQSSTMIAAFVSELFQCLESIAPADVSASACSCLHLLYRLELRLPLTWWNRHILSSAFERLLKAHPEIPQGVNLHPLVLALDDQEINAPLHEALYSLLALTRNQLFTKDARNEFQFRICLLAFACNLRECLKSETWVGDVSALKITTWKLRTLGRVPESVLNAANSWNRMISGIYRAYGSHDREYAPEWYSSAEPFITELADTCSLKGWAHEAELLFKILRSVNSSILVSNFRGFQISITYCLHLEREERYEELLDRLLVLYQGLEYSAGGPWAFISFQDHASKAKDNRQVALDIGSILDKVSDRLDQYLSSEKAREITILMRFFEAAQRGILASEREVNGNHIVAQADRVEAEDNDDQMDDCISSVRFGVTYTESVITGISFNYSDLYK
jgi:hypothetical protein